MSTLSTLANDDSDITLALAKKSIKQVEDSTERIKCIIEKKEPIMSRKPTVRSHLFSTRFASFVLICIILINAGFGLILYQVVTNVISSDQVMSERVRTLETELRTLRATTNPLVQKK